MKPVRKRRTVLMTVFAVFFVFAALFLYQKEPKSPTAVTAEKQKLRLALAYQPLSGLVIVAKEKGFFEASGLSVESRAYPSGKRALKEGLLNGSADIAIASDIPVMAACLENPGIRIAAAVGSTANIHRIVGRSDLGIKQPGELRGKRLATQKTSAVHYFLHLFLLEHGILEDEADITFMPVEALVPALAEGRIDAFSMREPYVTQARQLLGDRAVVFSAPGIYSQSDLAVTTEAFARVRPETLERFLGALVAAEAFVREHPKEAAAIIAEALGADKERMEKIEKDLTLSVSLRQSLVVLLENQARWALRASLVKAENVPDFTRFFYLKGLEQVKPGAVSIIQ